MNRPLSIINKSVGHILKDLLVNIANIKPKKDSYNAQRVDQGSESRL